MTPHEAEVLRNMIDAPGKHGDGWLRPLDFGGRNSSHHNKTAKQMAPKGWVEAKGMGGPPWGERRTFLYRLTTKGRDALANHDHLMAVADARAKAVKIGVEHDNA